jgi:hypothetical protein
MSAQNSLPGSIVKKLTPAEVWNARYNTNASVFVNAKARIDEYCKAVPGAMTELLNVIKDFKKANPNLTRDNMKLAKAYPAKLSSVRIDDTMNRPLDWDHVLNILRNYSATRVLAINVYQDPELPDCLIAWDGQHTTIVLYIIYCMIFEESASTVEIPVVISPTNNKAEIRENFIILNTEESKGGGKKNLDPLDLYSQKVFGVRMDDSNNLDWRRAELKQRLLEAADLFLTSTAYQNTTDDGAITQVAAIIDEDFEIVNKFCSYWIERKKFENRYVESKELIMLNNFFRACNEDPSVIVDDKFIEDMTTIFWNTFECEFTGQKGLNKFWLKLDRAYNNWYDKVYKEPEVGEEDLRPKRLDMTKNGKHQDSYGTTFMIYVLKKHGFKQTLPKPLNEFKPAKNDLW